MKSKSYLRFCVYLFVISAIFVMPLSIQTKEIKLQHHKNEVVNITLVKEPLKKKVKKVIKKKPKKKKPKSKPKPKPKIKPKPKPLPKPKPIPKPEPKIVKKIEPIVEKKEEVVEKKVEVKSQEDIEQKRLLAQRLYAKKTYFDKIYEIISENKRYPKKARRYKKEGSVRVSFKILSDGTIANFELIEHSKHKILNRAVKKLFKKLEKFPPPPSNLSFPLELSLSINYKLRR